MVVEWWEKKEEMQGALKGGERRNLSHPSKDGLRKVMVKASENQGF